MTHASSVSYLVSSHLATLTSSLVGSAVATYPRSKRHTPAHQQAVAGLGGHHAGLALVDIVCQVLDLLLEVWVLDILGGVWVGGLGAGIGVGERHVACGGR